MFKLLKDTCFHSTSLFRILLLGLGLGLLGALAGMLILRFPVGLPWGQAAWAGGLLLLQGAAAGGIVWGLCRRVSRCVSRNWSRRGKLVSGISQEIRTPVASILGMMRLLEETELGEQQRGYVRSVEASADSLLMILNDVLDFNRLEEGDLRMLEIPFDLRQALEGIAPVMEERARQDGSAYRQGIEVQVPSLLRGDPGRLRQILINLVEMTFSFVPGGLVFIEALPGRETEGEQWVRFDGGVREVSLSPEDRRRMEVLGKEPGRAVEQGFPVVGLGMSLARQLTELMGGRLVLLPSDGPEEGLVFRLELPFRRQGSGEAAGSKETVDLSDKRFLAAHGEESERRRLGAMMDQWGAAFDLASRGREVLEKADAAVQRGEPFDALLLDGDLEQLSGWELGRIIRRDARYGGVRLILLPRQGRRGDAAAAREAGFDGYMAPPVEKQALQKALRLVLAGNGSFDCDGGGAESAGNPESADLVTRHTVRETGMQGFRVLLVEDNGVNRLLMRTLVERAGFLYAEAEDGPSALEALRREPIDLILMDIQLPGMDGYELTRHIRRGEAGEEAARLPVIAVTANAAAEDRREGFAAGVDDYLPKPIDGDKLYEYLAYYAEMRGKEAGGGGMPRDWNRPDLERRLQGDGQILREMLDGFLADVPPRMERIRQAWAQGDLAALQEETHSLKGLSGTVGAEALQAEARGINDLLKNVKGVPPESQLNRLEKHWEKVQVVMETFLEEAAWEGGG